MIPRVIPILLLSGERLVKTSRYRNPSYVGDPVNVVKIFNEKEVDELVILDIDASIRNVDPQFKFLKKLATECFMPLSYGGGIKNIRQAERLFEIGVEKIIVTSAWHHDLGLMENLASRFGSQALVGGLDLKTNFFGRPVVWNKGVARPSKTSPLDQAIRLVESGVGELLINSVDREGLRIGYDIQTLKTIASNLNIPVIINGGAGSLAHMKMAISEGGASAVAAGAMFVYNSVHNGVLISYPKYQVIKELFSNAGSE